MNLLREPCHMSRIFACGRRCSMGIAEKRVCRQIRYQTPISPSRDPTSKTRGAMGKWGNSGQGQRRKTRPWALYSPLSTRARSPRGLCYGNKLPRILYTFTNYNPACCDHRVLETRETVVRKIDKIPFLWVLQTRIFAEIIKGLA